MSVALDRPVNPDYGVLLRATAPDGRELVRGTDAGSGRTDVLSAGLRWSAAGGAPRTVAEPVGHERAPTRATTVCLVVSNSFAPRRRHRRPPPACRWS